jgi:hypothetical protein
MIFLKSDCFRATLPLFCPRVDTKALRDMLNRLQQLSAVVLIALGALWSVQGAGIVHLKPILCFADCTEVQGPSVRWLATGLAVVAAGVGLLYLARRRARNPRTESE